MEDPVVLLEEGRHVFEGMTDEDIDYIECRLGQGWNPAIAIRPLVPDWYTRPAEPGADAVVEGHQAAPPIGIAAELVDAVGREQGSGSARAAVAYSIQQQREEVDRFMEWITSERIRPGVALASSSVFGQARWSGSRSWMQLGYLSLAHNRVSHALPSSSPTWGHRCGGRALLVHPTDVRCRPSTKGTNGGLPPFRRRHLEVRRGEFQDRDREAVKMEGQELPAEGNCELGLAHSIHTCVLVALNLLSPLSGIIFGTCFSPR